MSQAQLREIVDVQITRDVPGLTRIGFGTALVAAEGFTDVTSEVVQAFASLSGVIDAGFTAGTPIYRAAAAYFGQALKPQRLLIGEYDPADPIGSLEAIDAVNPDWYALVVLDASGTVAGETRIDRMLSIAEWIQAQERIVGFAAFGEATVNDTVLEDDSSLSAQLRELGYDRSFTVWSGASATAVNESLVNGDFSDDLEGWTAINNAAVVDGMLELTSNNTTVSAITQEFIGSFGPANEVTVIIDTIPFVSLEKVRVALALNGVAIQTEEYTTTGTKTITPDGAFNAIGISYISPSPSTTAIIESVAIEGETASEPDVSPAAYLGRMLPTEPGSNSWANKRLSGVTPASMSGTQRTNLFNKGVNLFSNITGVRAMRYGTMATGEYIDIIHGMDWLTQRIREDVFRLFINTPKVPYTDPGIAEIENVLRARLRIAQDVGVIAPDTNTPGFIITVPRALGTEIADRAARVLRGLDFEARLAGAIHRAIIRGHVAP